MPDYSEAWRRHRFWKRLPNIVFCVILILLLAMGQFPVLQRFDFMLYVLGLAFVACMIVTNIKLATFACPRCGKRFNDHPLGSSGWSLRSDLGRQCGHCGLALYGSAASGGDAMR